jgi:hypothetical protein
MHFHLPKPLHGWRAFVGEVGIIVVGVLIALAAQQVVEALHWRSETAKLRESLHREIRDDQWNAANRVRISECIRQRIAHLEYELAQPGTAWRADPIRGGDEQRWSAIPIAFAFPSIESFYTSGHWQTALASGELAHMAEAERNGYSYTYRAIEDLRTFSIEEGAIAAQLQPLAREQQLDNQQRLNFEAQLAALDRLNVLLTIYSRKFLEGTRRAGIIPRSEDLDSAYQLARVDYGACARPLGSTTDALSARTNASEVKPEKD